MPDTLSAILAKTRPREVSGSRTLARYDFQTHYSILKLIELLQSGAEFRLLFDVYDDLVVLNSADDPTEVSLYQIKSKDPGHWTCADICSKKGKTPPKTIVGRMFVHSETFGEALLETGLVSNAPYLMSLSAGGTSSAEDLSISAVTLHTDEVDKIIVAVNEDCDGADGTSWLPKLRLIRTPLGVNGQELVVIGQLQKYLEEKSAAQNLHTSALYQTLFAAVNLRARYPFQSSDGFAGALKKSLSRAETDELFAAAITHRPTIIENWDHIRLELIDQGISSAEQLRIQGDCTRYLTLRSTGHGAVLAYSEVVQDWIEGHPSEVEACHSVWGLAQLLNATHPNSFAVTDRQKLAAAIVEAYEGING